MIGQKAPQLWDVSSSVCRSAAWSLKTAAQAVRRERWTEGGGGQGQTRGQLDRREPSQFLTASNFTDAGDLQSRWEALQHAAAHPAALGLREAQGGGLAALEGLRAQLPPTPMR